MPELRIPNPDKVAERPTSLSEPEGYIAPTQFPQHEVSISLPAGRAKGYRFGSSEEVHAYIETQKARGLTGTLKIIRWEDDEKGQQFGSDIVLE
ncbi:MAG: hypothetical protein HQ536_00090 [Parcubacteria group bacterium]|nr:hypothetical protein [Parcubacteria group bacterium]